MPARTAKETSDHDDRTDCWICSWVFGRARPITNYCHKCRRGFCEGEHGNVSDGVGTCVICSQLEENDYECGCNWLDDATKDPHVAVGFDPEVHEYYVERRNERGELSGQMVIRYCPFCGGAAPPSLRDSLFERITPEEQIRLSELTKSLKTVADVLAAFGQPDEDLPFGFSVTTPEKDGQPSRTVNFRVLRYESLSPTALVDVVVEDNNQVRFSFVTKARAKHEG